MHEPVSLPSLFDAAEQAALGGDYAAAARLLADAARQQEATLGPDHHDLANTLNNLAVAHERSGDLDAAEHEYRRAHAIAVRTLAADDPLVATSAQNLRDFCLVNGRSIDGVTAPSQAHVFDWPPDGRHALKVERYELPAPDDSLEAQPPPKAPAVLAAVVPRPRATPPEPARPAPPRAAPPAPAPEPRLHMAPPPEVEPPGPVASARPAPASVTAPSPRRIPGLAIGIAVVVLAGLLYILVGRRAETPRQAPPEPVMDPVAPAQSPPAASTPQPAPPAQSAGGVTVGEANLCASFVNYRCVPAASPVRAGQLTFYTRLVATRDTAVVHRWYRGDQLRQAVRLNVPARTKGFRTFSRGTVYATSGDWRVELRTLDGQVLHTQTFTVR
jgi:hypothetical protein